jgi:hypothetical protein
MQQALERAGIKSNHGWSYAMNALEMASLMAKLKQISGKSPEKSGKIPIFAPKTLGNFEFHFQWQSQSSKDKYLSIVNYFIKNF